MTKEDFFNKAIALYGGRYDLSKIDYKDRDTKIEIICKEHGNFYRTPRSFLNGKDCPICRGEKNYKFSTESFITKSKEIHNNKYGYDKTRYVNCMTPVIIKCPLHGYFEQLPVNHIRGAECPKCTGHYMDNEYFIEKAKKIHGDKYDYSKVEYAKAVDDVIIICPKHGEFYQKPREHLSGCGCPKCGSEETWNKRGRITKDEFIRKAKEIHGDKYDYSKVEYVNERTPVCIICHKKNRNGNEHGEFWQTPSSHLSGKGCRKCRNSHLENTIRSFLIKNNIIFEQEKTFPWLKGPKNGQMFLDFYLPEYSLAIECQGIQHFMIVKGNKKKFDEIVSNDKIKKEKCFGKNIKILYFSEKVICEKYTADKSIIFDKNKLLEEIKK